VSIAALAAAANAEAQYFGQNKVQYKKFKFEVLKTEHFDIYYYPEEAAAAREAGRMAERWYVRLSRVLNHNLQGRQPVILYGSHPEFAQTNVVEGDLGEGTGGVTESARRRVTLPFGASLQETDHVLGHELVHAFQYDMLPQTAESLPLWFIEGMAEYLSVGSRDVQTAMWLRDAAIEDHLPTIAKLDDPRYFPYRFGQALWAYLGGRFGDEVVGRILHRAAQLSTPGSGGIDGIQAIETVLQRDEKSLSAEWHSAIRETYAMTKPGESGLVIGERSKQGSLSVGPALSPDGSKIAFLSSRGLFSIDLYLADAATGKVTRKLISTATDAHFESLQFLASAGTWDPSGKKLAIASLSNGSPELAIVDAAKAQIEKEIPFKELGEIFQPAWSPDGQSIAFSAQSNGYTDLYVYNFNTAEMRRLTNDAFADLHPAWTPDGKQITFVTDRFSMKPDTLSYGDYRLGSLTVATGAIAAFDVGLSGDVINPQWSTDGHTLFFISDATGRQELYRYDQLTRNVARLSDEATGIAGITPLSPALSVAGSGKRVAVSVFHDSGYEIRVRDVPQEGFPDPQYARDQALLPPGSREPGLVTQLLHDPTTGLPPPTETPTVEEASNKLQLIGAGSTVGASTGQWGTYGAGGIALMFSDVLGNHLLTTGISINGQVRDVAASVNYLNRSSRWNWGLFAQRLPLLTGNVSQGVAVQAGQPVFVQQTEIVRQTYTEGGALTAYPLSRATRVEFSVSASHIGFSDEIRTQVADLNGNLISDQTIDVQSAEPLTLGQFGAAIVRDTAIFGGTAPILGQRERIEVQPTFGSLNMTNLTLDVRRYIMPFRPVTFAGRALHIGRYGGDSEDPRLPPLYLGYPSLVRGYDINNFSPLDCTISVTSSCPEFDHLVGSRMLVFNGEVRAPLLGLFTGKMEYRGLPVDVFAFGDTGVAWTKTDTPVFKFSGVNANQRSFVSSVGFGTRVNLMGFLIAELSMAKPLNLAQQDWTFVFNLMPGF